VGVTQCGGRPRLHPGNARADKEHKGELRNDQPAESDPGPNDYAPGLRHVADRVSDKPGERHADGQPIADAAGEWAIFEASPPNPSNRPGYDYSLPETFFRSIDPKTDKLFSRDSSGPAGMSVLALEYPKMAGRQIGPRGSY
jgi:hypothetical protein